MALYIELVSLPEQVKHKLTKRASQSKTARSSSRGSLPYSLKNWNGGVMDNCNVHNNGQINIPRRNNVVWPHAINGENGDNIKILNSRIHNNHGEGWSLSGSSNWEISKNIVYDNWSVNIYVDTDEGNILDGNFVYNTGKYTSQARDYSDGIRIANEQADLNGGDPTQCL